MRKLLPLLLVAFTAAAAEKAPVREVFPNDYTPQACAPDAAKICETFVQSKMTSYATVFRGFNLNQTWVDAHWDELIPLFRPLCAKAGSCFTVKDNDWIYCLDLLREEFLSTCDRYPKDSTDHEQCIMFSLTYYIGLGSKSKLAQQSQECVNARAPQEGERTLQYWMTPEKFDHGFDGLLTVNVHDAETHIPVRAKLTIDAGKLISTEGPISTGFYPTNWKAALKRVPNAQGHRDVVRPTATLSATGYQTITFPMPIDVPTAEVTMSPAASALQPGKNTITITARDTATGEPVELRVMAGDRTVGKTNTPVQLELTPGKKRPEIWVTSLFDRYSDVVVAPAE
jgi:hypothetical protein